MSSVDAIRTNDSLYDLRDLGRRQQQLMKDLDCNDNSFHAGLQRQFADEMSPDVSPAHRSFGGAVAMGTAPHGLLFSPEDTLNNDFFYDDEFSGTFDANNIGTSDDLEEAVSGQYGDVALERQHDVSCGFEGGQGDSCTSEREFSCCEGSLSENCQSSSDISDRPLFSPPPSDVSNLANGSLHQDLAGSVISEGRYTYDWRAHKDLHYVLSFNQSRYSAEDSFQSSTTSGPESWMKSNNRPASTCPTSTTRTDQSSSSDAPMTLQNEASHMVTWCDVGKRKWRPTCARSQSLPTFLCSRGCRRSLLIDIDFDSEESCSSSHDLSCMESSASRDGMQLYQIFQRGKGAPPTMTSSCNDVMVRSDLVDLHDMNKAAKRPLSMRYTRAAIDLAGINLALKGSSAEFDLGDGTKAWLKGQQHEMDTPSQSDCSVQTSFSSRRSISLQTSMRRSWVAPPPSSKKASDTELISSKLTEAVYRSVDLPDLSFLKTGGLSVPEIIKILQSSSQSSKSTSQSKPNGDSVMTEKDLSQGVTNEVATKPADMTSLSSGIESGSSVSSKTGGLLSDAGEMSASFPVPAGRLTSSLSLQELLLSYRSHHAGSAVLRRSGLPSRARPRPLSYPGVNSKPLKSCLIKRRSSRSLSRRSLSEPYDFTVLRSSDEGQTRYQLAPHPAARECAHGLGSAPLTPPRRSSSLQPTMEQVALRQGLTSPDLIPAMQCPCANVMSHSESSDSNSESGRAKKSVSFSEHISYHSPKSSPHNSPRKEPGLPGQQSFDSGIYMEADNFTILPNKNDGNHKKALVRQVIVAADTINETRTQSTDVTSLVLDHLCPALYAILSDGLRTSLPGLFGSAPNNVWKVILDSTEAGPPTTLAFTLVESLKKMHFLSNQWLKVNAFVFGLLNARALDFWLSCLLTQENVITRHFLPEGLVPLAACGALRGLWSHMTSALQPLAQHTFRLQYDWEYKRQEKARLERLKQLNVDNNESQVDCEAQSPKVQLSASDRRKLDDLVKGTSELIKDRVAKYANMRGAIMEAVPKMAEIRDTPLKDVVPRLLQMTSPRPALRASKSVPELSGVNTDMASKNISLVKDGEMLLSGLQSIESESGLGPADCADDVTYKTTQYEFSANNTTCPRSASLTEIKDGGQSWAKAETLVRSSSQVFSTVKQRWSTVVGPSLISFFDKMLLDNKEEAKNVMRKQHSLPETDHDKIEITNSMSSISKPPTNKIPTMIKAPPKPPRMCDLDNDKGPRIFQPRSGVGTTPLRPTAPTATDTTSALRAPRTVARQRSGIPRRVVPRQPPR